VGVASADDVAMTDTGHWLAAARRIAKDTYLDQQGG
jgi:hypothetical protein